MIAIIGLILLVIALVIAIRKVRSQLHHVQLMSPTPTPIQQPEHFKYKLLHYSPNIHNSSLTFGLFQKDQHFYIVDTQGNAVNLRDIYPSFKGIPIGFVVISGSQLDGSAFIVFSSDGMVYNPNTISHHWRREFMYLPNENPISVDGRPISDGSTGLFNAGTSEILFRFYYSNYYIEESGCHPSTDPGTSSTRSKSCHNSKLSFPHPSFNVTSYYQYAGVQFAVSTDGFIYKLTDGVWTRNLKWTELFPTPVFPAPVPLTKGNFYLLGADYDDSVPIFLIFENGIRYVVDRHARKYNFSALFSNQDILPSGNPLDFTKVGTNDYDYLALYTNRKVYGPTLPASRNHSRNVADFETVYPGLTSTNVVSITSVNKWKSGYYLVFLYDNGQWFEVGYDIVKDQILSLGQTDQTSGKWTEWPHLQPTKGKIIKVSSYMWSVFVFDPNNKSNDIVYSINQAPENWIDMLFCTSTPDDQFKSSACVGLGKWKNFTASSGSVNYNGWIAHQDRGLDVESNPGTVQRKVSLAKCLESTSNVVVYDENESDCHSYESLTMLDTSTDPTKAVFVKPSYDPTFQNRFCVQHLPTSKYLIWDFTDPDNQHLSLNDTCMYQGDPTIATNPSPSQEDVDNLKKSLGAVWSLSCRNQGLRNLNGALGGDLQPNNSLSETCSPNFSYQNNTFTDGSKCFHTDDGSSFSFTPQCAKEWKIVSVPCPSFSHDGGYISEYCEKS